MKFAFSWLKNRLVVFLHDSLMIFVAWFGAYWLRFNLDNIPPEIFNSAKQALAYIFVIQILVYWLFGLYRGVWRFASLPDLIRIIKAVIVGTLISVLLLFLDNRLLQIPRSIFPLYSLLLITCLGGSRFLYRWLKDSGERGDAKRVLIVGAGQAGEGIARDIQRDASKKYQVTGFVDDKHSKKGQEIHGIRVLGRVRDMPDIANLYAIDLIVIAVPSASSAEMRRIVDYCEKSGVTFRTLPGLKDLTSGSVKIDAIREVSLEDLLGRNPVGLDWQKIRHSIEGQVILVTGGGGSIGSELCRQISEQNPRKLIVIENSEFNLYSLKIELSQKFPNILITGYLVDVTDKIAVREVFAQDHIDMVFHAAAYKHVPMLESQLRAAIRNNLLGTQIVAIEAISAGVKKFVLISTDKAVNPTNVMGATKRAAEIYCQNYNRHSKTQFITVRFGNVLGSAGSVVPLFRQQIAMGGPLTVTHPEITRYFMTISEASQLILQATEIGKGGEIFVLDMGEPIKIRYLAEQMILLAGLIPGDEIEIKYIGLRPGEKLFEELFHESEVLMRTMYEKILQASYRERDWNELQKALNDIEKACVDNDEAMLWNSLLHLVPEYTTADLPVLEAVGIQ